MHGVYDRHDILHSSGDQNELAQQANPLKRLDEQAILLNRHFGAQVPV
tara:strand:- start:1355 stop:1498 length:144 start_codon:yes stop_codon:yes gene_type:complete